MKLTIQMKPSPSRFRRYDYVLYRGKEVLATCTDLRSAKFLKELEDRKEKV